MGPVIDARRPRCVGGASGDGESYRGVTREGVSLTSECCPKATSEATTVVVGAVRR